MNYLKLNSEKFGELNIPMPSKWNELTKSELLFIANNWTTWLEMMSKGLDMSNTRVALFLNLLRCKPKYAVECIRILNESDEDTKLQAIRMVDFVLDCDLTENIMPVITNYLKKLYGPKSQLSNLTFGEFIFSEKYFEEYMLTRNELYLLKLVAILYRPSIKGARIDLTDSFDFESHLQTTSLVVTYSEMQAILLFYLGCHRKLEKMYKRVFSKSDSSTKAKQTVHYGMMNVAFVLSDLGGLGDLDDIRKKNIHIVLQRWELLMNERE